MLALFVLKAKLLGPYKLLLRCMIDALCKLSLLSIVSSGWFCVTDMRENLKPVIPDLRRGAMFSYLRSLNLAEFAAVAVSGSYL